MFLTYMGGEDARRLAAELLIDLESWRGQQEKKETGRKADLFKEAEEPR